MNKQSIREIFDNISLSVISFLENHVGITDVEFLERQGKLVYPFNVFKLGVAEISIKKWEEEHSPY